MGNNSNLNKAKVAKNDEFYTQRADIEKELNNYDSGIFEGKVVYCPCDSVESEFYKYFRDNFSKLKLKKLISTCINRVDNCVIIDSDGVKTTDCKADANYGSGDFRSEECTRYLEECDFVITNPPFSLFREFVPWIMNKNKKFLILGNRNSFTYKEIFPLFKNNKLWYGASIHSGERYFYTQNSKELSKGIGVRWFTNIDYSQRYKDIVLFKTYKGNESNYPYYDNYDAIEVSSYKDIPMDYDGVMGVPISIIDFYNPTQFEIIGLVNGSIKGLSGVKSKTGKNEPCVNGKLKYARIFIKRKNTNK